LRRDILVGNAEYLDVIDELKAMASTIASAVNVRNSGSQAVGDPFGFTESIFEMKTSMEEQLQLYAAGLSRLENLRHLDHSRVNLLADHLRNQSGEKEIFLFYQREFVPKIDQGALTILMSTYNQRPDIIETVTSLFEFFRREEPLDIEPIKRLYADSGASIHFLYLTRPAPRARGVIMEDQSEDLFAPFREMSRTTGGYIASTANIGVAMKSAIAASENYYLLYYTPQDYRADGRYHRLEVKVKGGGYRTSFRQGYIAD
jgi:hypothetical protein